MEVNGIPAKGLMTAQLNVARPPTRGRRLLAWTVHGYTAAGALAGFAMVFAVFNGDYRSAFLLMVGATIIDASDGVLARLAAVKETTPNFDGARLDDIVDYLTFVFVPAVLLYHAGLLPQGWGGVVAAAMLLSSAYGFSATDAKTKDYFFTGFPSYWNIVALYLYAARLDPWLNAGILFALSALVFVRIGYVYPTRTPVLRGLTIALCLIWGVMVIAMILALPRVPPVLMAASLVFPIYYLVLSLALNARRGRRS
jgi:phosphatidylcholine synthase